MTDMNINRLLADMRTMAAQSTQDSNLSGGVERADFGQLLRDSIDAVNETQQAASAKATDFEAGAPGVDLADVMLALQKADISFKAMTEVRNKLVDAYREIMNMPI